MAAHFFFTKLISKNPPLDLHEKVQREQKYNFASLLEFKNFMKFIAS